MAGRGVLIVIGAAFAGALVAPPAAGETVLITGANSGIGLEFTKQYAARGWTVIATHRRSEVPASLSAVANAHDRVRIERVDVTDIEQVRVLAARLAGVPIDVLINNAGVYNDRTGCAADEESCPGDWSTQTFGTLRYPLLDTILAVNVKGPLLVSEALFEHVKAGRLKKIVAISSSNGSLSGEFASSPGAIFYRTSKAALNRAMQLVANSVRGDGVTVVMLNPGPTLTEHQSHLRDFAGMLETSFTVEHMMRTIDRVTLDDTGRFLRYDGAAEPW